jgi:predicted dehydrogenase
MTISEVKILGAGSIGNHMAHASRRLGWNVTLIDKDPAALRRTQHDIYPGRYRVWDSAIRLCEPDEAVTVAADLIVIGTPPDSHMALARFAVQEKPKAVLIEKPICTPDLEGMAELADEAATAGVRLFVGYDHVVGAAAEKAALLLSEDVIGEVLTIDVEFREEWSGIFAAHPWLDGPVDSYLGSWKRGGGSTGEHSHALNFWQFLSRLTGRGDIALVSATMSMVDDGRVAYDAISAMTLTTTTGLVGRVMQDVVTKPPRKWARVQGRNGAVEWACGAEPGIDLVRLERNGAEREDFRFTKTRPDDFIRELRHIDQSLDEASESPLDAARGFETMLAIAAAYRSHHERRAIAVDASRGWTAAALS